MAQKDVVVGAFQATRARIDQLQHWVEAIKKRLTEAEKRVAIQGETIKKLEDRTR